MTRLASTISLRIFGALGVAAAMFVSLAPARADERTLPVPKVTIYPGDQITEAMLDEKTFLTTAGDATLVGSKSAAVGKVARRTLLPGKAITLASLDAPRIVAVGSQVKIIFNENGLVITTYGTAMQPGAIGDTIRVRNLDSGLSVSGRVLPDGSVRVSEG